jgi:hypothetical protein
MIEATPMSEHDIEMLEWVNKFNVYDLCSKGHTKLNLTDYDDLFAEFPAKIAWQQLVNELSSRPWLSQNSG